MSDTFLHGIETIEKNDGPRPIETIDTATILLLFTAPAADATIWPLNTPKLILGERGFPGGLGSSGTGPDAFDGLWDQASKKGLAKIMAIRIAEDEDAAVQMGNVIGDRLLRTGMHAARDGRADLGITPRLLVAPGFTSNRPTDGVQSIALDDAGAGYTVAPTVTITGDGTGAAAIATIDANGEVTEVVVTNPGAGYTGAVVAFSGGGGGAGAAATATLGQVANPVATELLTLANRFRAGVIVDGPNTDAAAAYQYRLDYDTDRMLIVDPHVKVFKGSAVQTEPASARVAGLQAKIDLEEGFWVSPSNHVLEGVVGTARVVEHSLYERDVESQYLNQNAIATVVRAPSGGWKLWGNRVPSSDPLNIFWARRRAHDVIIDSIEEAHEWAVDKPFSLQLLLDIAESVNAKLRVWKRLGATLGGRVWLDPELNTPLTLASGQLYIHYDAEGPAPLEHLVFVFNRNTGYYTELTEDAAREIARLASAA
ncbi:MAG: phage tail sheath subtilisin-like domain-containing protein [Rhodobiaceae bacterium]|nr:phage tail sheath subtilisin-like domain-containing protein [Rhodobiaceae bacterium]